jgi:hypothetical protein
MSTCRGGRSLGPPRLHGLACRAAITSQDIESDGQRLASARRTTRTRVALPAIVASAVRRRRRLPGVSPPQAGECSCRTDRASNLKEAFSASRSPPRYIRRGAQAGRAGVGGSWAVPRVWRSSPPARERSLYQDACYVATAGAYFA